VLNVRKGSESGDLPFASEPSDRDVMRTRWPRHTFSIGRRPGKSRKGVISTRLHLQSRSNNEERYREILQPANSQDNQLIRCFFGMGN